MNAISMSTYRPYQKLHPLSLLAQLISRQYSGCLRVTHESIAWSINFERGKFLYATTSVQPFERLDRQLQRLSAQIPNLSKPLRLQLRLLFDKPDQADPTQDYQAICWLVEQGHITHAQATVLIEAIAKEVLESFLALKEGSHELIEDSPFLKLPQLCQLELRPLVESCQHQLQQRQLSNRPFSTNVTSLLDRTRQQPVSRPAVNPPQPTSLPADMSDNTRDNPHNHQRDMRLNPFTHSLMNPLASPLSNPLVNPLINPLMSPDDPELDVEEPPLVETAGFKRTYTIACIDDSPTVLNAIKAYLDDTSFNVVLIDDPIKALMQVIHSRPALILLDVTMPNLDGYELCSLLRKHPSFKQTPIVMVTGKTGLIDRARARLVGASGYLTKPFSQSDLMKMMFQHLS